MHGKPQVTGNCVKGKLHTYAQEAQIYHTDTRPHFKSEWKRLSNNLTVALRKVLSTKSNIIIICNPASVVVGTTSMWSGKSPLVSKHG